MRSRRALRAGGMPSGSMMASSWPSSRRYNSRRGLRGQRLHEHHTVVVSLQRESTAMATGARGGTLLRASIETDSPSAVGPGVGFRVGLRVSFAVGLPGKHWQAARQAQRHVCTNVVINITPALSIQPNAHVRRISCDYDECRIKKPQQCTCAANPLVASCAPLVRFCKPYFDPNAAP